MFFRISVVFSLLYSLDTLSSSGVSELFQSRGKSTAEKVKFHFSLCPSFLIQLMASTLNLQGGATRLVVQNLPAFIVVSLKCAS